MKSSVTWAVTAAVGIRGAQEAGDLKLLMQAIIIPTPVFGKSRPTSTLRATSIRSLDILPGIVPQSHYPVFEHAQLTNILSFQRSYPSQSPTEPLTAENLQRASGGSESALAAGYPSLPSYRQEPTVPREDDLYYSRDGHGVLDELRPPTEPTGLQHLSGTRELPHIRPNREEGPPEYCIFCAPSKISTEDYLWGPEYPLLIKVYDPWYRYYDKRERPTLACELHVKEMDRIATLFNGMEDTTLRTYVAFREDGKHLHCATSFADLDTYAGSMRWFSQSRLEQGHGY